MLGELLGARLLSPEVLIALALVQGVVFMLLIRFLDLYEHEPFWVIAVMAAWGGIGAVFFAPFFSGVIEGLLPTSVSILWGPAIVAPISEELLKGFALVVAFAVSHRLARRSGWLEFDGLTDGLVFGAAIGLGFALIEDLNFLFRIAGQAGSLRAGIETFISRADFLGIGMLGHAVYTGFFGAGLGLATWVSSRAAKVAFPLIGLGIGMMMHGTHNAIPSVVLVRRVGYDLALAVESCRQLNTMCDTAVTSEQLALLDSAQEAFLPVLELFDFLFVVAFVIVAVVWLRYQRRVLIYELAEEMQTGEITEEEADLIPNYWRRARFYWRLLGRRNLDAWRLTRKLHNRLVDLAFLKWRVRIHGADASGIEPLRQRIKQIREFARAVSSVE